MKALSSYLRDEVGQHDFAADVEELAEAFERVAAAVEVVEQRCRLMYEALSY